jgi:hypothetical protein
VAEVAGAVVVSADDFTDNDHGGCVDAVVDASATDVIAVGASDSVAGGAIPVCAIATEALAVTADTDAVAAYAAYAADAVDGHSVGTRREPYITFLCDTFRYCHRKLNESFSLRAEGAFYYTDSVLSTLRKFRNRGGN